MKCQFNGEGECPNEGTGYPIICLPPPLPHAASSAARSAMPLATCEACQSKVSVQNFLLPEGRDKIASGFIRAGRAIPDFDRAWLEWGVVGDEFWTASYRAIAQPDHKLN